MTTAAIEECAVEDPISFSVRDVTDTYEMDYEGCDGHRSAGDVAASIAAEFGMDASKPYALRDTDKLNLLLDDIPLGAQIKTGARLVAIPKPHLG